MRPRGRVALAPVFHWVLQTRRPTPASCCTMHFELTRLFPPLRRALHELGTRWQAQQMIAEADDIFFLTLEEMEAVAESPAHADIVDAGAVEFVENLQRHRSAAYPEW